MQDDSFIHLRYADNLAQHHFITYDGVNLDYGASSLLYVAILAALRSVSGSADLARGVSSVIHLLLFLGLALGYWAHFESWTVTARLASSALLVLIVSPGSIRWLDDGMETGMVAAVAMLLAWLLHREFVGGEVGRVDIARFLISILLGFFTVLLRTELSLLCGVGFVLLLCARMKERTAWRCGTQFLKTIVCCLPVLLGAIMAIGFIFVTMHTLLPDTAKAKSHGMAHWFNPIHDTAVTLGGAMSFGVGVLLFWLVTLVLVLLHTGRISMTTILANCFFPVVLGLASLRGQEIQGVRYFAWTFFFAIVWNILELGSVEDRSLGNFDGRWLLYGFLALLVVELPFEGIAMHRVLTRRAATLREFEGQHLAVLSHMRGVASDIGYIGYFTQAKLCDLAGLVNGRAAATLTSDQRAKACVAGDPDFLFLSGGQLGPLARYRDYSQWQVCGRYDFTNVSTLDTHYLIVRPEMAGEACRAAGQVPQPVSLLLVQH